MFDSLVTAYLFLGGAGAALVVVLAVCDLLDMRAGRACTRALSGDSLSCRGFAVSLVVLALGVACLLMDLRRPERFPLVLAYPTPTLLSFGSYALTGTIALAAVLTAMHLAGRHRHCALVAALDGAAALCGAATVSYTGFFFCAIDFVPLWNNAALPILFVASSASTGIVAALGLALMGSEGRLTSRARALSRADLVAVAVEIAALLAYVAIAALQGCASSLAGIVSGPAFSLVFVGVIGLGLLAPLAIELLSFRIQSAALAALVVPCVAIGGYALRYGVVNMPLW